MIIKNMYEILDCMLTMIELYIVYAHVYGIEVSVFLQGKVEDTTRTHTLFYKIGHIKPSVWITGLGAILASVTWSEGMSDVQVLLYLFLIQAFSFCIAKDKKYKNSFWVWPVMFTTFLPISIVQTMVYGMGIQIDLESDINSLILDGIVFPIFIFIYLLDKKYNFSKRVYKDEKALVIVVSFVISLFGAQFMLEESERATKFGSGVVFLFLALAIFLLVMVIRLISVGTSADYYEELSAAHEKNARETLAFYESYKDAQIETRKLRHDMKNHLACIQMLAREEKYTQLREYLESFNEAVSEVSMEIQTGNDIVDAILNVKQKSAKKEKITFMVTGMIPYMPYIDAMDWCKMISNAVDNGMEALMECSDSETVLGIQFKNNGNFFVIHIENSCKQQVQIEHDGIRTGKQDKIRHGFGLKNIETSVNKYKGEMQISCKKSGEHYVFMLDLLLPLKKG